MTEMRDFLSAGGFDADETEDLASDAMGFFSNLPVVGGLVKAVTGQGGTTGGTSSGGGITGLLSGGPAQLLASLPMPPMPPMPMLPGVGALPMPPIPSALIPAMGQGIGQATGIAPAGTGIGALLGAGMGGLPFGTGPFPGALGAMMQGRFGQPGLPPAWSVEPASVTRGDWRDAADHAEKVGRAVVARVTGATEPQLSEIRRWLRQRAAQIQATAEHRQVMSDADFKSSVIEQLLQLRRQLGLVPGSSPVVYGQTLPNVGASFASKY